MHAHVNRRQPSTVKEQSKVADELCVSANVAYGQVKLAGSSDSTVPRDVYEELDTGGGATEYATCAPSIDTDTHAP